MQTLPHQAKIDWSFLEEKNSDFSYQILPVPGYELILRATNKKVGLDAIIAIHSTSLGPALGGTRIAPYNSFEDALEDVKRLSKGMTYKSAIAEVGLGGGKSVIIADPRMEKTPELLMAFGEVINKLQGLYICAEDMGCTLEDAKVIRKSTKYVTGLPHEKSSGDPGRFTAWGTFRGIQAAAKKALHSDSLEGVVIAISGIGNVGHYLIDYLFWAGADLILADIDANKAKQYANKYGARQISHEEIMTIECDIFAPCAIGAIINDRTVSQFRCKAIAGCANNQLKEERHADLLQMRDILYAPDYVINAGGLLNVTSELEPGGYDPKIPREKAHMIYDSLLGIFEIAEKNGMSTQTAANALAEYRIQYKIGQRSRAPVFPAVAF